MSKKRKKLNILNAKNNLELIQALSEQIDYLCKKYKVPGFAYNDLKQELKLLIICDYKKYGNKSKGWWFKRLQWHIYNMIKKSKKDPLNQSISIDKYYEL